LLDELLVADRVVPDGQLQHAQEDQSAAARGPAVESKDEFVQVGRQVGGLDRALVCAQQPPFEQRGDPVHPGQQRAGILAAGRRSALATPIVEVPELAYAQVPVPAVR